MLEMQRQLARWRRRGDDPQIATELAARSRDYSQQILQWSGLLE
jgi:hypothetical protein